MSEVFLPGNNSVNSSHIKTLETNQSEPHKFDHNDTSRPPHAYLGNDEPNAGQNTISDQNKNKKRGGYQKFWMCTPNSLDDFPQDFKDECKFILQQNQSPFNFIVCLKHQQLASAFDKFKLFKKVVPFKDDKKSLKELEKIYKLKYKDPLYDDKEELRQRLYDEKIKTQDIEKAFHENLCYQLLEGTEIQDIINQQILPHRDQKKAKILTAKLQELRQFKAQQDEDIFSDFCLQLMAGTSFEELKILIREKRDNSQVRVLSHYYTKLSEIAQQQSNHQENEIFSSFCKSLRTSHLTLQELESTFRENTLEAKVFQTKYQELHLLFQQTQQNIFYQSLVEGMTISELQQSVSEKKDPLISRAFLSSLNELREFSNHMEHFNNQHLDQVLAFSVVTQAKTLEDLKSTIKTPSEALRFIESFDKLNQFRNYQKKVEEQEEKINKKIKLDQQEEGAVSINKPRKNKSNKSP